MSAAALGCLVWLGARAQAEPNATPPKSSPSSKADAAPESPSSSATDSSAPSEHPFLPSRWKLGDRAVRGITIGPIESSLHPGRGYGTEASKRALEEAQDWGANWVSLTVFGRAFDLKSSGISMDFEEPYRKNRENVKRMVAQAHELGLRVLLVPHLWVETGEWRAEIDPATEEGWAARAKAYRHFVSEWAKLAQSSGVDLLAVGVELRSWVTTTRAPSFIEIIRHVRTIYDGPLTYAANWDDVDDTVILGELDVIGINAFYPLAEQEGASLETLQNGAREVADKVEHLATTWSRPVLFTEFGYTTRDDPAVRPWEWPDTMNDVNVNQHDQANAYRALLGAMLQQRGFHGLFLWRTYADPADLTQEAEWGFSPRGKEAELVLRNAYHARFAADGPRFPGDSGRGHALITEATARIGLP